MIASLGGCASRAASIAPDPNAGRATFARAEGPRLARERPWR